MNAKIVMLGILAVGAAGASTLAVADEGPLEARVRAVALLPANKSDPIGALGVPSDAIHINSKGIPEVDFEYFFTPNVSSELILTYPQKQNVVVKESALGGPVSIGTFRHLPPILTVKYNFMPQADFRPYVGAGVNLTLLSNIDLAVPTATPMRLDLKKVSIGPAVQLGFDYKVADHWFVNADAKWAMLRTKVRYAGADLATVKVDPVLLAVGVGYRW